MTMQGNLRDFPLSQLFNLIHLARKSGMLEIQRAGETTQLWFRDGKLANVQSDHSSGDLITILKRSGKLDLNQANAMQKRFGQLSDKVMGLHLVNANYLTQQEIFGSLESEYRAAANRLFYWTDGDFWFDHTCFPPEDKISIRMSLEQLIFESASRLQEAGQLQTEVPNLDAVLMLTAHPDTRIRKVNLSPDEWKVVSQINAMNSIRQIGRVLHISEFELRKTVHGLLQAGIVEYLSKPEEIFPEKSQAIQQPQMTKMISERKSLFNRLITHIFPI